MRQIGKAILKSLRSNLLLKITALFFAFILWGYVLAEENPVRDMRVQNVPIQYIGMEELKAKNLTINMESLPQELDVTVAAGQNYHKSITKDSLTATVNLSFINEAGTKEIKVQVTANSSIATIKRQSISNLSLSIEKLVEKQIPVKCSFTGEEEEGYYVGDPVLSQQEITIKGPESIISKAALAICEIPLKGIKEDVQKSYSLILLDEDGKEMDASLLEGGAPSVVCKMEVLRKKSVPIDLESLKNSISNVAKGYEITDVHVVPATMEIAAADDLLDSIESIALKPLNAQGANASVMLETEIQKVEGVRYLDQTKVLVYVQIEEMKTEKTFRNVKINFINLEDGQTATVSNKRTNVTISGDISVVRELTRKNLNVYVDLAGLKENVYELPVEAEEITGINTSNIQFSVPSVTVRLRG